MRFWWVYHKAFKMNPREQKLGTFTALNLWEIYNQSFRGIPGTKNWDFYSMRFVVDLKPNFQGNPRDQKLGTFTA